MNAVLDENADVSLIRRFFTNDAWLVVMDVVNKNNQPIQCMYVRIAMT